MDIHDLNLLPEINMQYQTPSQPQRYIRRSLSTRFPPPDFFETLNIPDEVIEHVFKYLTISELVNVMSVCRRFDRIGKKSRFWRHVDLSGITITQFALHHILERRTEIMKLTSAVVCLKYLYN
jgi:hypothetical protein